MSRGQGWAFTSDPSQPLTFHRLLSIAERFQCALRRERGQRLRVHCRHRFSRVLRLVLPCWSSSCVLVSAEEKWWKKDKNAPPLTVYKQTLAIASCSLFDLCCPTSSTNGVVAISVFFESISVRSRWETGVSNVMRGSQSPHAWAAEQREEHLSDSRRIPEIRCNLAPITRQPPVNSNQLH